MRILRQDPDLIRTVRERDGLAVDRTVPQLHTAVALIRIGVYEEALTIIDTTIAEARADGDQLTLARALLAQAQALSLSGGGDPHALIDQAQGIARPGDGQLLAQAALVRVGSGVPEDKTAALVELTEPLELLAADAPERVDLLSAAAVIVTFIDGSPAAERLLDAAQRLMNPRGPRAAKPSGSRLGASSRGPRSGCHGCARDGDEVVRGRPQRRRRDGDGGGDRGCCAAEYTLGNLTTVDELLPVLERAADRTLPFGAVRVSLCKTTNALARGELESSRSSSTDIAGRQPVPNVQRRDRAAVQQLLLLFESDELGLLADLVRLRAKDADPVSGTPFSPSANPTATASR